MITEYTAFAALERIRHSDREMARVFRLNIEPGLRWMRWEFHVEIMAAVIKQDIHEMVEDAIADIYAPTQRTGA